MTTAGDVLKRLRRARGYTHAQLAERTRRTGRGISTSQIGKVERGERKLTDNVFYALADALQLTDAERQQVQSAQAGTGAVDVVDQVAELEARMVAGFERLSGELRGQMNQVLDSLDRLRDQMRP